MKSETAHEATIAEDENTTEQKITEIEIDIETQAGQDYNDVNLLSKSSSGVTFKVQEDDGAEIFIPYENLEFIRTNYTVSEEMEVSELQHPKGTKEEPWTEEEVEEVVEGEAGEEESEDFGVSPTEISSVQPNDLEEIELEELDEPEIFSALFLMAVEAEKPTAFTTSEIEEYIEYVSDPETIQRAMELDDRKTVQSDYEDRLEEL